VEDEETMARTQALWRGMLMAGLMVAMLGTAACSRPTAAPGQATPAQVPPGGPGYPASPAVVGTDAPREGDPGYPPPPTPMFDPYPGKTETAAAGGAEGSAVETATATATP
jgi:hypothetical protein